MKLLSKRRLVLLAIFLFVTLIIYGRMDFTVDKTSECTYQHIERLEQYYCTQHFLQSRKVRHLFSDDKHKTVESTLPLIYIITPTKPRNEQKADLTRLSQTLRQVPRIHWIIVEDRDVKSELVKNLLKRYPSNYTHLSIRTNDTEYKRLQEEGKIDNKSRLAKGVQQRNLGLDWITKHGEFPSVFYFADDDNTYDLRLFEEMRFTKRVSVWPVGLAASARFETPIVRNGKVVGFASGWLGRRKFPVDMAAFAVNSDILKGPNPPRFSNHTRISFPETHFMEQLNVTVGELEPKADNCTKVLVWHTRTRTTSMGGMPKLESRLAKYNLTHNSIEI